LVAGERLRFDISHPKPIPTNELLLIENQINVQIRANTEVITRIMTQTKLLKRVLWRCLVKNTVMRSE
jgi:alanyl-tRNA synthetase